MNAVVRLSFADPGPDCQVRARLMGPRCRFASQVDVAYQFRKVEGATANTIQMDVIVPEPSLWEPTTPFCYEGPIEITGASPAKMWMRECLRDLQVKSRGLYLNGKPFAMR